jgi:hypothetical protein
MVQQVLANYMRCACPNSERGVRIYPLKQCENGKWSSQLRQRIVARQFPAVPQRSPPARPRYVNSLSLSDGENKQVLLYGQAVTRTRLLGLPGGLRKKVAAMPSLMPWMVLRSSWRILKFAVASDAGGRCLALRVACKAAFASGFV